MRTKYKRFISNIDRKMLGICHKRLQFIYSKLEELDNYNNPLSIAVFHAAVLAIITVAVSSYIIFYSQVYNDMVKEAIRAVDTINQLEFVESYYFPNVSDYEKYKTNNKAKIHYIHKMNTYLFSEKGFIDLPGSKESYHVPEDPAKRAEEGLKLLNMILHCYPFPQSLWLRSETSKVELIGVKTIYPAINLRSGPSEPLIFSDFKELTRWFNDFEITCDYLHFDKLAGVAISKSHDIYTNLKVLSDRDKKEIQDFEKIFKHLGHSSNPIDPIFIFSDFLSKFKNIIKSANTIKIKIKKIEAYKRKMPSGFTLIIFMALSFTAYLTGAIIPLFCSIKKIYIKIHIPALIYTIFLLYILIQVVITIINVN